MNWADAFTLRNLRRALVVLAITYAFLAGFHTIGDFDAGWHIATGRWVLAHKAIPSTDVLSYTSPGTPWIYPPFAGVMLYVIFSNWGFAGLSWFCALACAVLVGYLVLRAPFAGLTAPLLAMLAVPAIAYRMTPRAELFTMALFAGFLVELWRFRLGLSARLWTLPLFMLLWVNLHPGFVAGLGLLAAYIVTEALEFLFPTRRTASIARLRRAFPWLVATVVATLANPYGTKVFSAAASLAGLAQPAHVSGPARFVGELSSVRLSFHTLVEALELRNPDSSFWWLLAIATALALLAFFFRRFGEFFLLAGAITVSLQKLRYQGLFAIVVIVISGVIAKETQKHLPVTNGSSPLWRRLTLAAIVVLSLWTSIRIVDLVSNRTYVVSGATSSFGVGESWWFPERASAFVEQQKLPGNIFEPYNLGGFIALRLGPHYPDYIDGRLVSGAIGAEESQLLSEPLDGVTWRQVADRRNINILMFSLGRIAGLEAVDLANLCQSAEWRPVYMDEVSMVLLRQRQENRQWIDRSQINCQTVRFQPPSTSNRNQLFQFYSNSGAVMYVLSRNAEAEQAWNRALALEPADPNLHVYLAQLYQSEQRLDQAEHEYKTALSLKQSGVAWYALGRLYATQHRYPEAEKAIAASIDLTAMPANNYKALGQVRLKLRQPQRSLDSLDKAEKANPFSNGSEHLSAEFLAQLAESRAEAYRQLGNAQRALEFQQQATRFTPTVVSRWHKLSEMARASGQEQLAQQALHRIRELELDPESPSQRPHP